MDGCCHCVVSCVMVLFCNLALIRVSVLGFYFFGMLLLEFLARECSM